MKIQLLSVILALTTTALSAQPTLEKQIQTQLILAEDGDSIMLPEGKISLSNTLSLDAKKNIMTISNEWCFL